MIALLAKKYIKNFNMKQINKEVTDLFDKYNLKKQLADQYLDEAFKRELKGEEGACSIRRHSNPTAKSAASREKLLEYIDNFDTKIKFLKSNLTDDELIIFHYGIEEKETDTEIMDRVCKSYKTYLIIKKSCYIKVALRFNLVKNAENTIFKTIIIFD